MNIKKFFNYLDKPPPMEILPLEIKSLTFKSLGKFILKDINLSFNNNYLTVIMGPNGSGKTVLLKIINGLLNQTSGQIKCSGKKINSKLREMQSLVFQKPIILRRTVKENLEFILKLKSQDTKLSVLEYLKIIGLEELINNPARKLSLGEQQRLSVIRALASKPYFLMLDEPTANLDPSSTYVIEKIILAAKDYGIKIVFVTHDVFQAKRLADEVVFMDKGQIIEFSKAMTFFSNPLSIQAKKYLAGEIGNKDVN